MTDQAARCARHATLAARLAGSSDRELAALVDDAHGTAASIGGTTASLLLDGTRIFVKKVPLTALEQRPEHVGSTANLFGLPGPYHYGLGSTGFGAWRELAVHTMTTRWVLDGEAACFPLLYHARILAQPAREPSPAEQVEQRRMVGSWEGSPAVARRLDAIARAPAAIVLFMEHLPQTVAAWLAERVAAGGPAATAACDALERELHTGIGSMNARGLLHLDAHFDNLLTDGHRVYFADFGLALSSRFELDAEEAAFLARHRSYDRCYASLGLVRRLGGDGPIVAPALVGRHAPAAAALAAFFHELRTAGLSTPYPLAAIEPLLEAAWASLPPAPA